MNAGTFAKCLDFAGLLDLMIPGSQPIWLLNSHGKFIGLKSQSDMFESASLEPSRLFAKAGMISSFAISSFYSINVKCSFFVFGPFVSKSFSEY